MAVARATKEARHRSEPRATTRWAPWLEPGRAVQRVARCEINIAGRAGRQLRRTSRKTGWMH
eukprot:12773055-Alexandrium_andersonii.AAC.1